MKGLRSKQKVYHSKIPNMPLWTCHSEHDLFQKCLFCYNIIFWCQRSCKLAAISAPNIIFLQTSEFSGIISKTKEGQKLGPSNQAQFRKKSRLKCSVLKDDKTSKIFNRQSILARAY